MQDTTPETYHPKILLQADVTKLPEQTEKGEKGSRPS